MGHSQSKPPKKTRQLGQVEIFKEGKMSERYEKDTRMLQTIINAPPPDESKMEKNERELVNLLKKLSPFNGRWQFESVLSCGSYGVTFNVHEAHTKAKGVIKIATEDSTDISDSMNWENNVLMKIYDSNSKSSVVRLLDSGKLLDPQNRVLNFAVTERMEYRIWDWINDDREGKPDRLERSWRVTQVAIQMFKSIFDLHSAGILHRDLKPDNMGIHSWEHKVVMLFDLGTARMYTDAAGEIREPSSIVRYAGTEEYSSANAVMRREQTPWDDLISWLWTCLEMYHPLTDGQGDSKREHSKMELPWTGCNNFPVVQWMRGSEFPARVLLRHCPKEFFWIRNHLLLSDQRGVPDYKGIADHLASVQQRIKCEKRMQT